MSEEAEAKPRTFKVRNYVDAFQLKADSAINQTDLSGAMVSQASLFNHYGELAAKAARQVDDVKLLLENTEAAVYRKIRDDMATKGEKVTEAQLEKMVTRHARVVAMKKALNEAKQIEAIAKIAVESFRHRRDMLVQLGAHERKDMEGELAMRARASRDQMDEDNRNAVLARRAQQ